MNESPKTSGLAIAALIFSLLCCMPVGLILGIVALVQISNAQGKLTGSGLAIASIVISALAVPIGGVVAGIAIPNFVRYSLRAKTTEAKQNLDAIRAAQEAAREKYGRYLRADPSLMVPSSEPQPFEVEPCDAECTPDNSASCASFACLGFEPDGPTYFSYACEVDEEGANFTCAALGDLDGNQDFSLFVFGTGQTELVAPVPDFDGLSPGCLIGPPNKVVSCVDNQF